MQEVSTDMKIIASRIGDTGRYYLRITFECVDLGPDEFQVGNAFNITKTVSEQAIQRGEQAHKLRDQSERIAKLKAELAELEGNA